jgi:hypothetical protein
MGRGGIIQRMTILWISFILRVSEAGLSKIYPQNLKKTISDIPYFKLCMKKAW